LQFEAVERDFVSFLIRLLSVYEPTPTRFEPSRRERSYLATFPFSDLSPHVNELPRLALGVDAVELRADLLRDPMVRDGKIVEAYENPSLSYLSEQVALIRRHLPGFPLVFTLRTPAQGGRYPYPADAPAEALFKSLHHALKLGCDMIDIEMGLDEHLTAKLIQDAKERNTSVLISWRDTKPPKEGGFDWSSRGAKALYDEATQMGADVVKIVGTAGQVPDNFALRLFAAQIEEECSNLKGDKGKRPSLSAYNMGSKGRISRFLNSTLASVTHDVAKQLTGKGIIGNPSMTFNEIQWALHLSGMLEKKSFIHLCSSQRTTGDQPSQMYCDWFRVMGLPYCMELQITNGQALRKVMFEHDGRDGDLQGILVGDGVDVLDEVDGDANVEQTGYCDTVIVDQSGHLLGVNKLVEALHHLIERSISPSVHFNKESSAVVISSSASTPAARSAMQAIKCLGLENVTLIVPSTSSALALEHRPPTIVIDACEDATLTPLPIYYELLAAENGGECENEEWGEHPGIDVDPSQASTLISSPTPE
jgi:pentafunctional AROM polypeptide